MICSVHKLDLHSGIKGRYTVPKIELGPTLLKANTLSTIL